MGTKGAGSSRGGGDWFHNEDAFGVDEGLGLYVVCDGASGSPAGEVAANVATKAVEDFVERADEDLDLDSGLVARKVVERAMRHAMASVAEAERRDSRRHGLDTTVTLLLAHGDLGVIGHRGDSRAYLIRRNRAHQLTVDHELTEPTTTSGGSDPAGFDVFSIVLEPGDTVVLCTDGAEAVMLDEGIVRGAGQLSPRTLASLIVSKAHRREPSQDATAVVVRVRRADEAGWLELSLPPRGTAFGHTLDMAS